MTPNCYKLSRRLVNLFSCVWDSPVKMTKWIFVQCLFAIFVIVNSCDPAEPFAHILGSGRGAGSVFDVDFTVKSGIAKSGFENNVRLAMQMIAKPFDNLTVYIRIEQLNGTAQNGENTECIKLLNTFEFLLKSDGKIVLRKGSSDDDIIKVLASVLFFNTTKLHEHGDKKKPFHYASKEEDVYGREKMYFVKPQRDGFSVEQNSDPMDFNNMDFASASWSNRDHYDLEELKMSNYRKYDFVKRTCTYSMKRLQTEQHIFFTPKQPEDLKHFLHTSYDFRLNEEATVPAEVIKENLFDWKNLHDFKFAISRRKSDDNFQFNDFLSNPENVQKIKREKMLSEVERMLKGLSIIKDPYTPPNIKHFLLSPVSWEMIEIVDFMKTFTEDDFSAIHKMTLKAKDSDNPWLLRNFVEVLPLVGTSEAAIFCVKLIKDPTTEFDRDKMLMNLAGSIRSFSMSVEALNVLKDLTMAKDAPHVALLAYARALMVTYHESNEHVKSSLQFYTDKLSNARNYDEKRTVLEAIACLRSIEFIPLLWKTVLREDEGLKIHALYALMQSIGYMDNSQFTDLLNLAVDQELSTEVRAVAVRVLLRKINREVQFEALARRLHDDPNHELYNFFASKVMAMIEEGNTPSSYKKLLRRLEPEARSRGFYFKTQNSAMEDFAVSGHIIFDDVSGGLKQVQMDLHQSYQRKYSLLLRLDNVEFISRFNNFQEDFFAQQAFKYEISVAKAAWTIFSKSSECDFQYALQNLMMYLYPNAQLLPNEWSNEGFLALDNTDYFLPMDAGRHFRLFAQAQLFFTTKFAIVSELSEHGAKPGVIFSVNATLQASRGMEVLNPNLMAFQGSRQMSHLHFTKQFAFNFHRIHQPKIITIAASRSNALTPLLSLRIQKQTQVYLNRLRESSNTTEDVVEVSGRLESFNSDGYLTEGDWQDLGINYGIRMFSYKPSPSGKILAQSLSEMLYRKPFSGMFSAPLGDIIVSLMSFIQWNFFLPGDYGVDLLAHMRPSDIFDTSKIQIKIQSQGVFYEFLDNKDNVRVKYLHVKIEDVVARMPAEGPTSSICLKFETFWREMPEWRLQILFGSYPEKIAKCVTDQSNILIESSSKFTGEQIEFHHQKHLTYAQCRAQTEMLAEEAENCYTCATAATMLRDIMVWLHYKNLPSGFENFFRSLGMWVFANSGGFHEATDDEVRSVGEIQIGIYRPMDSDEDFEMTLYAPENSYTVKGSSKWLLLENSAIQSVQHLAKYFLPFPVCRILPQDLGNKTYTGINMSLKPWVQLAQINSKTLVYAYRLPGDQLAIKVQYGPQEILIFPRENECGKHRIIVSEDDIDRMPLSFSKNRLSIITIGDTVFVLSNFLWSSGDMIGYNGRSIFIRGDISGRNEGLCFR
ncbi:uncharacterized protein LOC132262608 [Phlebotomus argentipes]|uniref:uncharacterized protein LOC132262608 n=1 Tax=Phlebotomus argentipes TaxID=94469 RepID=UPI002892CC68|nr:uncharacterized protein LOC132262608 [Phlebotomus argentipes]